MSKRKKDKKNGKQDDKTLQTLILLTAIINIIASLIELIKKLLWTKGGCPLRWQYTIFAAHCQSIKEVFLMNTLGIALDIVKIILYIVLIVVLIRKRGDRDDDR